MLLCSAVPPQAEELTKCVYILNIVFPFRLIFSFYEHFIVDFLIQKVLPPKRGTLPQKGGVGEEGFEPPTPWFVTTCSNPLSYRPHPVSIRSVPRRNLQETFPLRRDFSLIRCESASLSILIVRSEV